ncbi:MAG: Ig-like domain-containing protein, partial [Planctomycetota bacterium]
GYSGGNGLGGGVLESHDPARNATGIPRNTMIYVTFKEPMQLAEILENTNCPANQLCNANTTHIKLRKAGTQDDLNNNQLFVIWEPTQKMFEFNPYGDDLNNHLGNPNSDVRYQMVLDDLKTGNDEKAFPFTGFYDWEFTVNNVLDLTPPTVVSVLPAPDSLDNPRNSAVQIIFSEAISPRFVTGKYPQDSFINIKMEDNANNIVNGEYIISNQYRTVDFITDTLCGTNSCGGDVYCLPGPQTITGTANGTQDNSPIIELIEDAAGNVLDGDNDGIQGGDHSWSFGTNNTIDLTPPVLNSLTPVTNVNVSNALQLVFSRPLLSRSINTDNIGIYEAVPGDVNYWIGLNGNTVYLNHDKFKSSTDYHPIMSSGIKDGLQNCWYHCDCNDPAGGCVCDDAELAPPCTGNFCRGRDL